MAACVRAAQRRWVGKEALWIPYHTPVSGLTHMKLVGLEQRRTHWQGVGKV